MLRLAYEFIYRSDWFEKVDGLVLAFLPPRLFIRLLDGRLKDNEGGKTTSAVIAQLPLHIGGHLPTVQTDIRIDVEYARKIILKHGLLYDELMAIPELIDNGYCFREKKFHLTFMGFWSFNESPYTLVIKRSQRAHEVWVTTLHRTNHQQMRSKVMRARRDGSLFQEPYVAFEE